MYAYIHIIYAYVSVNIYIYVYKYILVNISMYIFIYIGTHMCVRSRQEFVIFAFLETRTLAFLPGGLSLCMVLVAIKVN